MATSYYIYYRVAPEQAAACEARVQQVFAAVHDGTGISGRLLRKRGEPHLWMEIYEGVGDGNIFERALEAAVRDAGIAAFLQPGAARHVECFE